MEINVDNVARILTTRVEEFAISIRDEDKSAQNAALSSAKFLDYLEMLHQVNAGTLLVMYASLIGVVQVKFQNEKLSPFETHGSFMIMSVVSLSIAAFTSGILFYRHNRLQIFRSNFSPVGQIILVSVALFSTILAPLSLLIVLFIPPKLIWIGYSIVCALFVAVVVYNFIDYVSVLGTKMHICWETVKEKFEHQLS